MSAADFGERVPATPRLQSVPGVRSRRPTAPQQTAKLDGLAWVDQSAGTVRIPIQAAMQLIVQRADTFADPQAKAPVEHSWSFPGASMPVAPAAPTVPAAAPAHGDAAPPTTPPTTTPPPPGGGH